MLDSCREDQHGHCERITFIHQEAHNELLYGKANGWCRQWAASRGMLASYAAVLNVIASRPVPRDAWNPIISPFEPQSGYVAVNIVGDRSGEEPLRMKQGMAQESATRRNGGALGVRACGARRRRRARARVRRPFCACGRRVGDDAPSLRREAFPAALPRACATENCHIRRLALWSFIVMQMTVCGPCPICVSDTDLGLQQPGLVAMYFPSRILRVVLAQGAMRIFSAPFQINRNLLRVSTNKVGR